MTTSSPTNSSRNRPTTTPARLSALSTNLLTSILEVSQQNSLELPVNPSTKKSIVSNLTKLRDGLIQIGLDSQTEVIVNLRKQYMRIVTLVAGLDGLEDLLEGIQLELPKPPTDQVTTTLLIDVGENTTTTTAHQSQEDIEESDELDPIRDQSRELESNPIEIELPNRYQTRRMIQEDEELIRNQNEDVRMMQSALIDDQDRTLDQLSHAISRQRDLSLHISSELEVQESLLNDLDEGLNSTSVRLNKAHRRMNNVFRLIAKDGACWTIFGLVAVLLLLIVLLK